MNTFSLSLVILLVILVVGWFAAGTYFNVRRGHKALAWLQQSLKLLGEKTTLRWLGSSVVELKIVQAREPFRQAEVLVVLEPRDVLFLWASARMAGRRDLLILRGTVRPDPAFEFEAFDPQAWTARGLEAGLKMRNWDPVPLTPPLTGYAAGRAPVERFQALLALPGLVRLSVRRRATHAAAGPGGAEPNFEVHCRLREIQAQPARELFDTVRAAVPAATGRPAR